MHTELGKVKVFEGPVTPSQAEQVILEPLTKGYGYTYGSSIRRILMSSMPGASVVGVKIPNVYHEFSVIEGATTDMVELILNLKKIRFELPTDEIQVIQFDATKEGDYTAQSLVLPNGVSIKNPAQPLIQLTGNTPVKMDLYVKMTRGYIDADNHVDFESDPQIIKVDGMFSPIQLVGYQIEEVKNETDGDYERLIMTIKTDGSISAKEAVMLAGKITKSHFDVFAHMSDIVEKEEVYQEKKEEEDRIMDLHIEQLNFSVRAYNCLRRDGHSTVRKIYELSEADLYKTHQMGEKSVLEVIDKMKELGLELRKS